LEPLRVKLQFERAESDPARCHSNNDGTYIFQDACGSC
jgi:hypothetical protein